MILDYFIVVLKPSMEPAPLLTPVFVIVVGLLLYLSSTFFLFVIASRLPVEEMQKYWSINSYSNILTNLIISFAFLLSKTAASQRNPLVKY
jgi:ABC-type Na+ efflux pump permease subunit